MQQVVCGFFDDSTGDRIGRLQIQRVGLEFKRQGFLRVGWRPLVVLDGVTLEIAVGAALSSGGTQIVEALMGGDGEAAILRQVVLTLVKQPAQTITASSARLRPDGALELSDAVVTGENFAATPASTVVFWLTGPRAGQWHAAAPNSANASSAPNSSSTLASHQPAAAR